MAIELAALEISSTVSCILRIGRSRVVSETTHYLISAQEFLGAKIRVLQLAVKTSVVCSKQYILNTLRVIVNEHCRRALNRGRYEQEYDVITCIKRRVVAVEGNVGGCPCNDCQCLDYTVANSPCSIYLHALTLDPLASILHSLTAHYSHNPEYHFSNTNYKNENCINRRTKSQNL